VGAAGLALAAVLVVCVVAPPEIRGAGQAAVAAFVALAVAGSAARAAGSAATRWVFAALPVALVAIRMALAPGEAIEPAACLLLGACAGIAAAHADEHGALFAWLFGALVTLVGGHALYETFFGLAAAAARVRASVPAGAMAAVLNRLEQGRPYAGFLTPAALGCFLIMTVPPVVAWALGKRGGARAFGLGAASLGAAGLVATRSVSALVALAAALGLASLRGRVAPRVLAIAAGAIGLAVVGAGIARSDSVFAPTRGDSPSRLRAGNVRIALEIVRDHPLVGVGPGGYAEAFPQYRRPGDNESRHAHDLPAELAAEWGVPVGLLLSALFFWMFVGPVVLRTGEARTLTSGLAIGLAAFALHNLVDFTAFLPSLLVFAAVSRGLLAQRVGSSSSSASARAAWIALAIAIAAVAAGAGLSRDALFDARGAAASGDHAGALGFGARAERLAPWDADPPQLSAEARMALGAAEPGAVLDDADRAVDRAPARAAARVARARARTVAGDVPGAYADLAEAARLYPLRPEYAEQRDAVAASLAKAGEQVPR